MKDPELSIVVVSYNMSREIPRTLYSLSPAYQRGIDGGRYEVLLVDNGSAAAPRAEDFAGLDLDLRALRCPAPTPSPVGAINHGIAEARGRWIGVWIDGARIASPGLLAGALDALRSTPRAVVATRGRYLGPGLQSKTMRRGYGQQAEDALLRRTGWETDGYRLFDVSVFDESSGPTWSDPILESNSLFLSRAMWAELEGYDPRFGSKGGGLANHDVLLRAFALPAAEPIVLEGEATFHQFHGGTMTNAADQTRRWLALCEEYRAIRGIPWSAPTARIRRWGSFTHTPPRGELVCRMRRLRGFARSIGYVWEGLRSSR